MPPTDDAPTEPRPTAATTPMAVGPPRRRGEAAAPGPFGRPGDAPPPAGDTPTDDSSTDDSSTDDSSMHQVSVFAAVGGQRFFDDLCAAFYRRVAEDPVLLRLYPDQEDLAPAAERLALFLGQYWGGPGTYSERRGHPRLRMRHAPYVIGEAERDHWLAAMTAALVETMPTTPLDDELRSVVHERMQAYVTLAADHLVNAG